MDSGGPNVTIGNRQGRLHQLCPGDGASTYNYHHKILSNTVDNSSLTAATTVCRWIAPQCYLILRIPGGGLNHSRGTNSVIIVQNLIFLICCHIKFILSLKWKLFCVYYINQNQWFSFLSCFSFLLFGKLLKRFFASIILG